jgi:hypothetical protein
MRLFQDKGLHCKSAIPEQPLYRLRDLGVVVSDVSPKASPNGFYGTSGLLCGGDRSLPSSL